MRPTDIQQLYGGRVRIRACGLLVSQDKLLMVRHTGLPTDTLWAPPGGGVKMGETLKETIAREFLEEAGLEVRPGCFGFVCEYIAPPLHAVEIFFHIDFWSGKLTKGRDPEAGNDQNIAEVAFLDWGTIDKLEATKKHGIFQILPHSAEIMHQKGHFILPTI